jgi:hypothetical protein
VLENKRLKGMFRPRRDEVTRAGRKLHSKQTDCLYFSPKDIRKMRSKRTGWTESVNSIGEIVNACR